MLNAKPWQLVVLALGAVALVASVVYIVTRPGEVEIPDRITLIDVSTGDLYEANLRKTPLVLPARSPDGTIRLVPVTKGPDGKWVVSEYDLGLLKTIKSPITAINTQTGEVLKSSGSVQTYKMPAIPGN